MMQDPRYKVARQHKTGTVVATAVHIGEAPAGFEGDWPGNGRVNIVAWRKKLTIEQPDNLARLGED
jgi:hypothetical protein